MKERLVGAAVLVAIGAWLIPWVLDGPGQVDAPESTALELPAPAAEEPPIKTETIVLERRDLRPAPSAAGATANEVPAEAAAEPVRVAATDPAPAAVASAPATTTKAATQSGGGGVPAASAPREAAGTRWYVQLGAFGERANADRLASRVQTYGYTAHVSAFPSSGRTVHRVRVGPESTRGQAESIASTLAAHGFVAQVVFE